MLTPPTCHCSLLSLAPPLATPVTMPSSQKGAEPFEPGLIDKFVCFKAETDAASPLQKLGAASIVVFVLLVLPVASAAVLCTAQEGSPWRLVAYAAAALWLYRVALGEYKYQIGVTPPLFPRAGHSGTCRFYVMFLICLHGPDCVYEQLLGQARHYRFGLFGFDLPSFPVKVVNTPAEFKQVLDTNFLKYEKGPQFHTQFFDALGDGIFNSDGAAWKEQRRTSAHLFTSLQLENRMAEVFQRRAQQVASVLKATKPGETVDMQRLMYCYTFDAIYEIAFGKEVNSMGGVPADLEFQQAFDFVQKHTADRFFQLPFTWRLRKALNIGKEAKNTEALKVMREYVARVIRERRSEEQAYGQTDLIALLEMQNATNRASGDGKVYSDAEIIDFITNFTIAGRDTTAAMMTWFFYELSQPGNRTHRDALEAEFAQVESVADMHYAQAVLQEVLRKWPSVPIDTKICCEEDVLPDGTHVYPGEAVVYSPLVFSINPANYERPTAFVPERWLAEDGTCNKYDMKGFTYPMFNAGPRTCLGRNMAMVEAKTLISTLMSEFRIEVPADFEPRPKFTIVLTSRNGMPVTVVPRNAA